MNQTLASALRLRPSLAACLLLLAAVSAQAQINVGLSFKRSIHLLREPVIATVTIVNNSGRDLMLADTEESGPWFSFQINTEADKTVETRAEKYDLEPLEIKAGDTVKRTVNLNSLYKIDELGLYRVRAQVYFPPTKKTFVSKYFPVQMTEGTVLWKQTVGVPDAPEGPSAYRTFELVTLEQDRAKYLYARVQNDDTSMCYGCYRLGPLIRDCTPDAQFDRGNNLWVLQLTGPKQYLLTSFNASGEYQSQTAYEAPKAIPRLRKLPNGTMQIVGAYRMERTPGGQTDLASVPKLSDRPPGLPK